MHFWFHDDISESHLQRSLSRALRQMGHKVSRTGKFSHLSAFPQNLQEYRLCEIQIDRMVDASPDVFISFRPASIPLRLLERAKRAGLFSVAWFSDDPVYFSTVYAECAPRYDLVLHTGGVENLNVYSKVLGLENGVEFPFWTDETEHKPLASSVEQEADFLFLGNVHDSVRSDRLSYLEELGRSARIFGKYPNGRPPQYHLGRLESTRELSLAAPRFSFGLSFSQQMSQYYSTVYDSAAVRAVEQFPIPSRIVQYMSLGLPVVSRDVSNFLIEVFPEIIHAPTPKDAMAVASDLTTADRRSLSLKLIERREMSFSARVRAQLLVSLIENSEWRKWGVESRAYAFTTASEVDLSGGKHAPVLGEEECNTSLRYPASRKRIECVPASNGTVALVGTGWLDASSPLMLCRNALEAASFRLVDVNPYYYRTNVSSDVQGNFKGILRLDDLDELAACDAVVVVGDEYIVTANAGVPILSVLDRSTQITRRLLRKVDSSTLTFCANPDVVQELQNMGNGSVYWLPTIDGLPGLTLSPPERLISDGLRVGLTASTGSDGEVLDVWGRELSAGDIRGVQLTDDLSVADVRLVALDVSGPIPRLPVALDSSASGREVLTFVIRPTDNQGWETPYESLSTVGTLSEFAFKLNLYFDSTRTTIDPSQYSSLWHESVGSFADIVRSVLSRPMDLPRAGYESGTVKQEGGSRLRDFFRR